MNKKSRITGLIIITVLYLILQLVIYLTSNSETWAYMVGYGAPIFGYIGLLIIYTLFVSIHQFSKDISEQKNLLPEERLTPTQLIKKHSLAIFLFIVILVIFIFGRNG